MHRQFQSINLVLAVAFALSSFSTVMSAELLRVVETNRTIVIKNGDRVVVTYNKVSPPVPDGIDPIYRRSGCLHPVVSPQGRTVTAMFPADHPHQHGVFSAWVKTTYDGQPIDFWNLAGRTGRVLHERVVSKSEHESGSVSFQVDLVHRRETQPPLDVLRERWKITAHPTAPTHHCFDLEVSQTAITEKPLTIHKYHYGGVAYRGPVRWLSDDQRPLPNAVKREPSEFLNNLGSDRTRGNHEHAKWVALTGLIEGKPVTIAVLGHPDNFRSPQAARLHPTKPYFSYSPCVDGSFQIDQKHPYRARFRYLVSDDKPDSVWINQQWKRWAEE